MKCSACNGGLFIPLDDHIDAFCCTSHFPVCSQYTLYSENQILLLKNVRKSEENRRKHRRIETSQPITLLKIFESGRLASHFLSGARTIDVSRGGMRMTTDKPLTHETVIQFSFDDSFPEMLHEVTGQVEWCNKQVDEPGYQAGVSFRGAHIIEAMGRYLEQRPGYM
jgi:hypothetical protein